MRILVVGLGLIGGSIARRLSEKHSVFAIERNADVINCAIRDGAITAVCNVDDMKSMDVVFLALPPAPLTSFISANIDKFGSAIVADVCGVKGAIAKEFEGSGVKYIGLHPMAGREVGGYFNSTASLFDNANLVVTDDMPVQLAECVELLGFGNVIRTTDARHDRIIAYTSQLCHIISNAYAKSPTAESYHGFSGGSFEDLTRVGMLDPDLWTQLFKLNSASLIEEIRLFIGFMSEYQAALESGNYELLFKLLYEGSEKAALLR